MPKVPTDKYVYPVNRGHSDVLSVHTIGFTHNPFPDIGIGKGDSLLIKANLFGTLKRRPLQERPDLGGSLCQLRHRDVGDNRPKPSRFEIGKEALRVLPELFNPDIRR